MIACLFTIVLIGKNLKTELAPLEDHSVIRTTITAPEGSSFDFTSSLLDTISAMLMDSVPESRLIFARAGGFGASGSNSGFLNSFLLEPSERKQSQQQIYDRMVRLYKRYPQARIFPNQEQTISTSLSSGSQLPVQFVLQNLDFSKLQEVLPKFLEEAQQRLGVWQCGCKPEIQ